MINVHIPIYRNINLVSFRPLCMNAMGMRAVHQQGYNPFVDFSCRREPDFDNKYPSISALCRRSKFAPHLEPHDIVIYTTLQGAYPPITVPHYRLVAILHVEQKYATHRDGEIGYNSLGALTPRNCMVSGNPPLDFDHTAGDFFSVKKTNHFLTLPLPQQQVIGRQRVRIWDNYYQSIPSLPKCEVFVRTTPVYLETANPAPIYPKDYAHIFGRPSQAPKHVTAQQLYDVGLLADININVGQKIP